MRFMVIERFRDNDMVPIYRHLSAQGRGMPDGLSYVDSWVAADFSRCFQLMDCDDPALLQQWVLHWRDTGATFEIVPVTPAAAARTAVEARIKQEDRA
jgi:hypothetical protein